METTASFRNNPLYTLLAMVVVNNQKSRKNLPSKVANYLTRSATSAATAVAAKPGLWQRYIMGLSHSPFTYKGMTSGTLKALSKITAVAVQGDQANLRQILGTFVYGYTIDTYMCHIWYTYLLPPLETALINLTVGQNAPALLKVALTTAFSSTVFDLPYVWVYYATSGYLTGLYKTWEEAKKEANKGYYQAWYDGLKVWPGFTFLCMYFLPRDLVVPAGNLIGYFWNTYFMLLQAANSKKQ